VHEILRGFTSVFLKWIGELSRSDLWTQQQEMHGAKMWTQEQEGCRTRGMQGGRCKEPKHECSNKRDVWWYKDPKREKGSSVLSMPSPKLQSMLICFQNLN
jgi:hypothetical protein